MGDLIRMPHSELHATIEVLDRLGVTPHDFEVLRKASSWSQATIARVHKTDDGVWATLELEDAMARVGFQPGEIRMLVNRPDLLQLIRQAIYGKSVEPPEALQVAELWKKVSETAINVNLGFSPKLPFGGAVIEKHVGDGWVTVEKRGNGLYVAGTKVVLVLVKRQQNGKWIRGYELRDELSGKPVLNANLLDALCDNPHLIPEDWKRDENDNVRYIFFWGTIYRDPGTDDLYVRYLYFYDGAWCLDCDWLGDDWGVHRPAALLAS